jgi:hypothetical protein
MLAHYGDVQRATMEWWDFKRREAQYQSLGQGIVTYDAVKDLLRMPTGAEVEQMFDPAPETLNPDGGKEFTVTFSITMEVTTDMCFPEGDAPAGVVPSDIATVLSGMGWLRELYEQVDCSVHDVKVTGPGDDLDDGQMVTVEVPFKGEVW